MSRKRTDVQEILADLTARITENREHLAGMRQKAELLARDDISRPADRWTEPGAAEFTVRDEDVEVAYYRAY